MPPIELDDLLEKLPQSLADQIRPPLFPLVYTKAIDNKEVLVVQVFPGSQKPYFLASDGIKKGVYVRIGTHTRRAEGETLEELHLFRNHLTYDEAPITACKRSDLDLTLLPPALRSEKALFSLDLSRRDEYTGEAHPTRGAVLMLYRNPEKYVPEAEVIVSKMRGSEGRSTIETQTLTGPVPTQADQALDLLAEWLGKESVLKKGQIGLR